MMAGGFHLNSAPNLSNQWGALLTIVRIQGMSEQIFYNQDGIMVTNSRFIVHGQTYTMSGITSVKINKNYLTTRNFIIIAVIIPAMMLISMSTTAILAAMGMPIPITALGALASGALALIAGILLFRHKWVIVLTTSSGEVKALENRDKGIISEIVNALNSAIIARG
jgi:uncharacterized membrane protein